MNTISLQWLYKTQLWYRGYGLLSSSWERLAFCFASLRGNRVQTHPPSPLINCAIKPWVILNI